MSIENRRNSLFVEWINFVKQVRRISLNAIYIAIGISRAKGTKIRSGDLNAQQADLENLVQRYPELIPLAEKADIGIDLTDYDRDATVIYLKEAINRLEEENKRLRELLK